MTVQGRLRSYAPKLAFPCGENSAIHSYYKMCETSQRLFPRLPLCISTRYTLGKGRHIYKFGIDLSLLSRYIDTKLLQMLVSERQFWDPAHVFYTIDVNFKRYGSFRRQCHKTISLISRRLDPPTIPSSLYYGRSFLQSYRAITCDMLEIADEPQRTKNESLPLYSPALVLRAGIISGDRLWQTGEFLGLKLWITVPYGISKQLKLCLQSVRLSLINATVHNMQDHGRTLDLTGTVIATIRRVMFLNTKPDEDTIEIDSSTWRSSTESLQSLAAFTVTGQDSLLQVLCEFSSDKMMNNMFASVLIPVTVATVDGPPGYEDAIGAMAHGLPEYEPTPELVQDIHYLPL